MASPGSPGGSSDTEPTSSPPQLSKSFVSRAITEDDDARTVEATPEPAEKTGRGRGRGGHAKGEGGAPQVGKIRHLKKEDGEPLWREDIQYDFLRAVFDDEREVFTSSYEPMDQAAGKKMNFADLYIDTMSRSTKTSKVLRDKLLSDREAAKGMAMVCLLVNLGRMNTTLNFFPEMRAQLRTYHAIPSLQASQDAHAYKQLQDAPRLKSILKGGAEDRPEPGSLDKVKQEEVPRTNPVNLIFVMCNAALKVAELHFPNHQEFHDLIMKKQYSSKSRAMAFLWLMWFYLESDFTEEGCEENPFGEGVDYGLGVANQGIPKLVEMTEEEQAEENKDTEEEIAFGREKQQTRAKYLEMDQQYLNERETKRGRARVPLPDEGPAILPRIRPSKHESDMDSTRSTPPPRALARGLGASSRRSAPLKYQLFEASSPAPQAGEGSVSRKPRPPTAHQLAVERNRNQRVEYILDRGLRKQHHKSKKLRRQDGAIFRAYRRLQAQANPFEDSDDEAMPCRNLGSEKPNGLFREAGIGGLALLVSEQDDFGEEVSAYSAALRRSVRRLDRWSGHERELGVISTTRRHRVKPVESKPSHDEHDGLDDPNASLLESGEFGGDVTLGPDMTMDLDDVDQTVMADDDDGDDPDKTELMEDLDMA